MNYNIVIIYKYEISTMIYRRPNSVSERLDLPLYMRHPLIAREFEMKATSFSILLSPFILRHCRLISFSFLFFSIHGVEMLPLKSIGLNLIFHNLVGQLSLISSNLFIIHSKLSKWLWITQISTKQTIKHEKVKNQTLYIKSIK